MAFATAAGDAYATGKATRIGETDWNDPMSVAACAKAVWEGRKNTAKARAEAQAYRNLSYVMGDQWWTWSRDKRRMVDDDLSIAHDGKRPAHEKQLTFDQISPILEMRLAKLIRSETSWDSIPVTDDPEDIEKATASQNPMRVLWDEILRMSPLMRAAHMWRMVTKTVFFKASWDKMAGDPKSADASLLMEHPDMPPMGGDVDPMEWVRQKFGEVYGPEAGETGQWSGFTGEAAVELVPLFEVNVWPFNCIQFSQAQVWVHTFEKTAREIADRLGKTPDEVRAMAKSRDSESEDYYRNQRGAANWQGDGWSGTGWSEKDNDSILVHEVWLVPCGQFPNGRTALVIGETCIPESLKDIEYCDGFQRPIVPLFPMTDKIVPNSLWGRCTVDGLIDPQTDFNLAASQWANARNMTVFPTIFRKKGDGLSDFAFTQAPGRVNEIQDFSFMPQIMERPTLGTDHAATMQTDLQMLREIGGIGQVDYGTSGGGNPQSGRGVLALQEQNDLRALPSALEGDECVSRLGDCILWMEMNYGADERIIPMIGEDNKREVVKFRGHDLRPSTWGKPGSRVAYVTVQAARRMPSTRAETRQLIDSLVQNRTLQPDVNQEDKAIVLRAVGIGSIENYVDRDRKHVAKQQGEIDKWRAALGQPPISSPMMAQDGTMMPPNPPVVGSPSKTDKHLVHVEQLASWMNTDEYDQLAMQRPDLAAEISAHMDAHKLGMAYDAKRQEFDLVMATMTLWNEYRNRAAMTGVPEIMAVFSNPMLFLGGGGEKQDGKDEKPEEKPPSKNNAKAS